MTVLTVSVMRRDHLGPRVWVWMPGASAATTFNFGLSQLLYCTASVAVLNSCSTLEKAGKEIGRDRRRVEKEELIWRCLALHRMLALD